MPVQADDDVGDVVGGHLLLDEQVGGLRLLGLGLAGRRELLLQRGQLAVLQPGRGLEVAVALRALDLALQLVDALLELTDPVQPGLLPLPPGIERVELLGLVGHLGPQLREPLDGRLVGLLGERQLLHLQPVDRAAQHVDLDRAGVDLHPLLGRGLVDEVDRLVRQEPRGDVAVGQGGRGDERAVADLHLVVRLVARVEPAQDRDRVLDGRLGHQHLLEAPLERRVLLDVLAVLVERGGADHPQLAAREHRLEHVAGVHGALAGGAGADDGVQLVDERDHLAAGVLDLLQDGLEPLLELAAELRAGDHRAEVERDDPLALQRGRDVLRDDPLREALDHRGLADAGLADQHRVVLRPAGQDLHDPADLGVAPDDRVDLAVAGGLGEVVAVLLQRLEGALGIGRRDPLRAADRLDGVGERGRRRAVLAQDRRHLPAAVGLAGEGEQEVFGGDELVAPLAGLALGRARDRGDAGERTGAVTDAPDADGSLSTSRARSARTAAGSAPTACSAGRVSVSPSSSSATARCAGSTDGLPRSVADVTAALTACWLRVVMSMGVTISCLGVLRQNAGEVECVPLKSGRIAQGSTKSPGFAPGTRQNLVIWYVSPSAIPLRVKIGNSFTWPRRRPVPPGRWR